MSDDSAGQLAAENARLRRQLAERDAQLTRLTEGATQTGTSRAGARITVHSLYLLAMIAYFCKPGSSSSATPNAGRCSSSGAS